MSTITQRKRPTKEDEPQEVDNDNEILDDSKSFKLTLLEEIILLGIQDSQVSLLTQGLLSFWNDTISYVLRGTILIELSFRNRISLVKDRSRRDLSNRLVAVTDEQQTGEVLLDEALRYIKGDSDTVANWIDLLSGPVFNPGETWNISKIGYQLKQVRERISKGLVEKGVLRTEKKSFIFFDVPTHPVQDPTVKEKLVQRIVDCLLGRGAPPDRRTIACVCAAYAANVLENALVGLNSAQREQAFQRVDEILVEFNSYNEKTRLSGSTEIMAG